MPKHGEQQNENKIKKKPEYIRQSSGLRHIEALGKHDVHIYIYIFFFFLAKMDHQVRSRANERHKKFVEDGPLSV